jgi:hypothetical protein
VLTKAKKSSIIFGLSRREGRKSLKKSEKNKKNKIFFEKDLTNPKKSDRIIFPPQKSGRERSLKIEQ